MRLFTAIDLPDALRNALSTLQTSEALEVRWTAPDQFHVTVRFIGDATPEQTAHYEATLADIDAQPVRCAPYGLDVLPSRHSPSVLILGLERTDSIMTLYNAVSDALEAEGLAPEGRTYRPHVTLGRLDDPHPETVHDFLQAHQEHSFSPFEAEQLVLFKSTLTPEGALHEPRVIYPLTG